MIAISIEKVSFHYPGHKEWILKDFSLQLQAHKVLAVIGKSGCGKSTLMRLISGLLKPTEGRIVLGKDMRVGVVFQDPRLLPWKTVFENVALPIRNETLEKQKAVVDEVLELVGLGHAQDFYPSELSGGMAQRAALARALVQSPDILLMDEPFGALDAITRAQIQMDFESIQQRKKMTVVLITHEVNEAVRLADSVLVMSQTKIIDTLDVQISHPRSLTDMQVVNYAARVLNLLTHS